MIVFRVLGPVGVAHQPDDSVLSRLRGVRAVLAALLHNPNQHVTIDRLAERIWPNPPASAHPNLRTHIAELRRALSECSPGLEQRLTTRRGGRGESAAYRLAVRPDEVDAAVFIDLADRGREQLATRRPRLAAANLRAALCLWRGPIGEDLPDTPTLRGWAAELTERRLTANDDLAEARLQLADHTGLVAHLRRQLGANPHRERTAELLMRALHADGDRSAAIAAYEQFRTQLVDDLGIEPSARLQELHVALLRGALTANGIQSAMVPIPLRRDGNPVRFSQPTRRAPEKRHRAPIHLPCLRNAAQ
jgi:DNA-binding SARP family transcriptional activator